MFCTIYKITNTVNGKVYVGQTWNSLVHRFGEHKRNANNQYGKSVYLENAITKYGSDSFIIELLMVCATQEVADYWEQYFIERFCSRDRAQGYNIKSGGSFGGHALETRIKISDALKGVPKSEQAKINMALGSRGKNIGNKVNLGRKHTVEHNKKISTANVGESNPFYGMTHSETSKIKMRKPKSEEHKRKLSEARRLFLKKNLNDLSN